MKSAFIVVCALFYASVMGISSSIGRGTESLYTEWLDRG